MKLRMVGCSHHRSGAAVREQLAFTAEQAEETLARWRQTLPEAEGVLLSTCNRVEFYAATASDRLPPCPALIARHLAEAHNIPVDTVRPHLVTLRDEEAVEHLFRVAASLDSMVLGEPQILAQVKEAYERAQRVDAAGPVTHECFQRAIRVARRVATETDLHKHRVSIPSIAISDFAAQIFERFDDKQVVVLGAGEMADETLRYLTDRGVRRPVIANRSPSRAEQLAAQWGGVAASLDDRYELLAQADLVIGATAAGEAIVRLEPFRKQVSEIRGQRPLFLLDLSMPRDFETAIGEEPGVYLYSIDDLTAACEQNRHARRKELPRAERIIGEERERFFIDARHRVSAPIIARLREGLDAPKQDELERLFNKLPNLDSQARLEIERFADRLVNKMLHPPMESLRDESRTGSPHSLLQALSRLFQLKD
ncbi:glutamyl-tRNA reductase [Botrimarina hoheduenensis]|uniref:Glutamyl-tRNA reductase n=1 Tax=Botrimarina hoheduenensis TaxID=2528000 RepID=A0A5C5WB70_9BACT|nr:glutamyl-tRNA reductase [Botrimarina hoheduenensis]TWT46862.1 Glutamyl-tRNA reductase [Botrimarina hoheduenensis]